MRHVTRNVLLAGAVFEFGEQALKQTDDEFLRRNISDLSRVVTGQCVGILLGCVGGPLYLDVAQGAPRQLEVEAKYPRWVLL